MPTAQPERGSALQRYACRGNIHPVITVTLARAHHITPCHPAPAPYARPPQTDCYLPPLGKEKKRATIHTAYGIPIAPLPVPLPTAFSPLSCRDLRAQIPVVQNASPSHTIQTPPLRRLPRSRSETPLLRAFSTSPLPRLRAFRPSCIARPRGARSESHAHAVHASLVAERLLLSRACYFRNFARFACSSPAFSTTPVSPRPFAPPLADLPLSRRKPFTSPPPPPFRHAVRHALVHHLALLPARPTSLAHFTSSPPLRKTKPQ